jgi:hypothetical protein
VFFLASGNGAIPFRPFLLEPPVVVKFARFWHWPWLCLWPFSLASAFPSLATTSPYFVGSLTSIPVTMNSYSDLRLASNASILMSSLGLDAALRSPISFCMRLGADAPSSIA